MENSEIALYKQIDKMEKENYSDVVYPHEASWSELQYSDILNIWKQGIEKSKTGYILNIHIPYCSHKCSFCTHAIQETGEPNLITEYLDALENESKQLEFLFRFVQFDTIYISGGTPSILSVSELQRLYSILLAYFDISEVQLHMFEGAPSSFSLEKIRYLASVGVNKVTFGVQDIDVSLLKEHNRYQTQEKISQVVKMLNQCGITNISTDIMGGISGQTLNQFKKTLDFLNELPISNICLNIFQSTLQTPFSKQGRSLGIEERKIIRDMEAYYIANNTKQYISEELYPLETPNTSCLSLGYGGVSHIFGRGFYKKRLPNFNNPITGYIGREIDLEDEIIRYIVPRLQNEGISFNTIAELFSVTITKTNIYKGFLILLKKGLIESYEKEGRIYFQFISDGDTALYGIYSKILYSTKVLSVYHNFFSGSNE